MEELKAISCDPLCGFKVQSHNEKEIIEFAKEHLKKTHKMKLSDKEAREKLETV